MKNTLSFKFMEVEVEKQFKEFFFLIDGNFWKKIRVEIYMLKIIALKV